MTSKNFFRRLRRLNWLEENLLCLKIFCFCLRVQTIYSPLGLLFISIQSLILIIQTSTTSLLNLATSLTMTVSIGPFHPPTHRGHKLLKKLDQNRTAYTVQQKPFIRFPHLPNSRSLRSAPTYSMDYYGEINTNVRRTKHASIKFTQRNFGK